MPTDDERRGVPSVKGQLLTADQLAARWQVKSSHVYRLTRNGRITVGKAKTDASSYGEIDIRAVLRDEPLAYKAGHWRTDHDDLCSPPRRARHATRSTSGQRCSSPSSRMATTSWPRPSSCRSGRRDVAQAASHVHVDP